MHRVLVTLFCIVFVVGINGAWLKRPAPIDDDAVELTELTRKFWSLTPAISKKAKPLVYCQIIEECCEDEDRSEAVSLMSEFIQGTDDHRFVEIMNTCMNSTASNEGNSLCSSIVETIIPSRIIFESSDVVKYIDIISKYDKQLSNLFGGILSTCNGEETHAVVCLSNKKLMETCIGKILQKLYDDDYENYQEIMVESKQVLIDLNQQLSEAFTENTDT